MRKLWRIVILIAALGILLGAYFYLSKHPQNAGDSDSSTASKSAELIKVDSDKLNKIQITNEKGSLSLEKTKDKWIISGKSSLKLDETTVDTVVSNFTSGLSGEKLVESNAKDLNKYGLDKPRITATAILKDGTSKTVCIGNETYDKNSYYIKAKDNNNVYTLSVTTADTLNYSLNDLRSKDLTAIDTSDIRYIKIVNTNGKTIEIKSDETKTADDASTTSGFVVTKPYSSSPNVSSDKMDTLNTAVGDLKISGFLSDTSKELSKYGLDKPKMELVVKDSKNELRLYFGKTLEDGEVAFKVSGAPAIYSIEKEKMDAFDVNAFDIIDKYVYAPSIDTVNKISIEDGNKKYDLSLMRTTKKAEKEGESDETVTTYKVNNKTVEEASFKSFYEALIGMTVESENNKNLSETPQVRITYTLNKGSKKATTLSFVNYNEDFYAVFIDGKSEFLISKLQMQSILDKLESIAK